MFSATHVETTYGTTDVIVIYRHIFITMMMACAMHVNRNVHNVGRYAHDPSIDDRTWTGTLDDMSVGDFVHHIGGDTSTYETAVAENIVIKYYLEMVVDFQRTTQDGNVQYTSASNNLRCGELGH